MNSLSTLTEGDCRTIVMKDWKGGEFDVVEFHVDSLSGGVSGFLSDQLKLKVSVREVGGGGRVQTFHYFIKSPPNAPPTRTEYVKVCGAIDREVTFYSEMSSDLKVNEVADEECCKCVPAFYLAKDDSIIMEDLAEQGYTMVESRTAFDLDHCRLVLKALANLHAATIVFEERRKKESPEFVSIYEANPRYVLDDRLHASVHHEGKTVEWVWGSFAAFRHLVKILPKYKDDQKLCRRIAEIMPVVYEKSFELVRRSDRFRNVVCHGDLWSNNIMFRHDAEGKPDRIKFVDYQFVRYLPPASDVMIFLHTTTRRQFREKHEDDLLRLYHRQFIHTLTTHGLSEDLLPEEEFRESCDQMRQLGRIMSAVYAMMILMPGDFLPAILSSDEENFRFAFVDRGPEACMCFHADEIFRERGSEIMEEFIDHCVIPIL